jgi:hypothetical protein
MNSGCKSGVPHAGYLIDNRNSVCTLLEPGKSKIKAMSDLVPGEGPLLSVFIS